ncbi:MAG TPA: decarboxylating 6-phosphogluconate dehydrogenase [Actinomycetota bacterium]|nr:decarboxylating 6-phosphogluconate dehydrogenase [Actinomycetota bacterium]
MQLGMVGLGRMGSNISRRLLRDGHRCVVTDLDRATVDRLASEGAVGAEDLGSLAAALDPPRAVWLMVPAGDATEAAVRDVAAHLEPGDVVIDGGNTFYRDDVRRAAELGERGIRYVDCGTSGGIHGLERGFCLMVGGDEELFTHLEPIFASLAPGVGAAPRTPNRTGEVAPVEQGYVHCGPVGAGHFVKMVHNGIEYGLMAAYAEGFDVLRHAPDAAGYPIDVAAVAEVWRRGSVVSSWLLDLTAAAVHDDPELRDADVRVADSGEGRWTAITAIEAGVPAEALTSALFRRFASRDDEAFANRVLSAMRRGFGGHTSER